MTTSQGPDALRRLAEQSRSLLGELDHARPELLSVAELNRTLRQVLANQAALLDALSEGVRPQIKVLRAKASEPAELNAAELEDLERTAEPAPKAASNGVAVEAKPVEAEPKASEPEPAAHACGSPDGGVAALLAETKRIPMHLCRGFVCDFDNRDRDYDKGLEKLNRWISAGSSGTPFQWRGDHAYLNLKGAGAHSARTYEEQIMARMGFSRRLGRLDVPGLEGDVVVYERPS
ncbi:MAG: hypothetical protein R3F62_18890 [Planctomycetota bacterium]